jgi:HEAT repeat protein
MIKRSHRHAVEALLCALICSSLAACSRGPSGQPTSPAEDASLKHPISRPQAADEPTNGKETRPQQGGEGRSTERAPAVTETTQAPSRDVTEQHGVHVPDQSDRVQELAVKLKTADENAAVPILVELGKIGDPRALPVLIEATTDDTRVVQIAAIVGLARTWAQNDEAADAMTRLLSDPIPIVRYNAALHIGQMDVKRDEAITGARPLLADEQLPTRAIAACRIGQWRARGESPEGLALTKDQRDRILHLAKEFGSSGSDDAALTDAMKFLIEVAIPGLSRVATKEPGNAKGPRAPFVQWAQLEQIAKSAELATEILQTRLDDPDPAKRRKAAATLQAIGPLAHQAVPRLRQLAQTEPNPDVLEVVQEALTVMDDGGTYPIRAMGRRVAFAEVDATSFSKPSMSIKQAREILGRKDQDHSQAIESLFTYLSDPDAASRTDAIWALRGEVTKSKRFVLAMRDRILDQDYGVRLAAASALQNGGEHVVLILPDLLDCLRDPGLDDSLRRDLVRCIGAAGPGAVDAVPILGDMARKGRDYLLRANAAMALGQIGPGASSAVPALVRALSAGDSSFDLRGNAAEALGKIGPGASGAIPHLVRLTKDKDAHVRHRAIEALGGIGPAAKSTIPVLIEALGDPDKYAASAAAHSLGEIGMASDSVVEALIRAMDDGRDVSACAMALGELGSGARKAVPSLAKVMVSRNHNLGTARIGRYHAIMAIGKIGGPEAVAALESMPPTGNPHVDKAVRDALALARAK